MSSTRYIKLAVRDEKYSAPTQDISLRIVAQEKADEIELKSAIDLLENSFRKQHKCILGMRISLIGGMLMTIGFLCLYYFFAARMFSQEKMSANAILIHQMMESYPFKDNNVYSVLNTSCGNLEWYWDFPAMRYHELYDVMLRSICPDQVCITPGNHPINQMVYDTCCPMIQAFCENLTANLPIAKTISLLGAIVVAACVLLCELINVLLTQIIKKYPGPRILFIPFTKDFLSDHQKGHVQAVAAKQGVFIENNDIRMLHAKLLPIYQHRTAIISFLSAAHDRHSPIFSLFQVKPLAKSILQLSGLVATNNEKEQKRRAKRLAFFHGSIDKNKGTPLHHFFSELNKKQNGYSLYKNPDEMLQDIFVLSGMQKLKV